jgi:hypothetical protein
MKYVRCPKCGTENVANRIICVKCAENLADAATYERFDVADLFSGIKPSLAAVAAPAGILTIEVVEKARRWDEHVLALQGSRLKTGANNFYWIAAVSVIETYLFWTGKRLNFFDSLGITQLIDLFAKGLMQQLPKFSIIPQVVAIVLDLALALLLVWLANLAHKGRCSIFIIGMGLYALDMLIVIRSLDLLSIAFHLAVLAGFYRGLRACLDLKKEDAA